MKGIPLPNVPIRSQNNKAIKIISFLRYKNNTKINKRGLFIALCEAYLTVTFRAEFIITEVMFIFFYPDRLTFPNNKTKYQI